MSYLKLSTMQYPLYEGDIRLEHPEITEDQTGDTFPVPSDYVLVDQEEQPKFDFKKQKLSSNYPIQKDGKWIVTWTIVDLTEDEKQQLDKLDREMMQKHIKTMKHKPVAVKTDVNGSPPNVIE